MSYTERSTASYDSKSITRKHIGASIDVKLYWKIKTKLAEKEESMSESIVNALKQYLKIDYPVYVIAQKVGDDSE